MKLVNGVASTEDTNTALDKCMQLVYGNDEANGKLIGKLRWASVKEIAETLDAKLRVLKDREGREACLAGYRLTAVELPDKVTYVVREHVHPSKKTRHPKCRAAIRQYSPDWCHGRAVFSVKTKKFVHDELIREGVSHCY